MCLFQFGLIHSEVSGTFYFQIVSMNMSLTEDWLDTMSCARPLNLFIDPGKVYNINAIEWCVKMHNSVLKYAK